METTDSLPLQRGREVEVLRAWSIPVEAKEVGLSGAGVVLGHDLAADSFHVQQERSVRGGEVADIAEVLSRARGKGDCQKSLEGGVWDFGGLGLGAGEVGGVRGQREEGRGGRKW